MQYQIRKSDISYDYPIQGGIVLSAIVGDALISRRYFDYSKKEARILFMQELRDLKIK